MVKCKDNWKERVIFTSFPSKDKVRLCVLCERECRAHKTGTANVKSAKKWSKIRRRLRIYFLFFSA